MDIQYRTTDNKVERVIKPTPPADVVEKFESSEEFNNHIALLEEQKATLETQKLKQEEYFTGEIARITQEITDAKAIQYPDPDYYPNPSKNVR